MRKFLLSFLTAILCTSSSWAATQVILIRHGETDWNAKSLIQGQSDVPLNENGNSQAKLLAEHLITTYPDIDAIYSSDLQRAYSTALFAAKKYNKSVHKRSSLRECSWGDIEGLHKNDPLVKACYAKAAELSAANLSRQQRWDVPFAPGGESDNQVLSRFQEELLKIAHSHPDQTVLVFSHGHAIRTLLSDLFDVDEWDKLSNCARVHISIDLDADKPIAFHKIEELAAPAP